MDEQNRKADEWNRYPYGQDDRNANDGYRQESENARYESRHEPEPYTYGPIGRTPVQGESGESPVQPLTEVVPTAREYRPFTVSGGGGSRGGWEGSKPKGTSLRAVFASFMVGVIVVGGLMFAADRGDWFSTEALANSQTSAGISDNAKAATASVSNAADVVRPNNIAKIFDQASPAVVKIETYAQVRSSNRSGSSMFDDPFFRQFFGDENGNGGTDNGTGSDGALQESGMGSGFIFDSAGYILTNEHVVADADKIEVTVIGHNKPFTAKLLGYSRDLDLAVLKIEGPSFPTLKLGDSDDINMGDWVVAIGNPYGFDHTVTVGVLSSNEREINIQDSEGTRQYQHLLQTDASINPGNSGGPLLNLQGEVIGINTAVSSEAQGIGFAIPTSTISGVLDNLKANVKIPKPFIGANLVNMTDEIAKKLGVTVTEGALVDGVMYGSPAYKGDLRQYDIITGIDGTAYKTREELIAAIQKKQIGDTVKLNVVRGGEKLDITVKIGNKSDFENAE